MYVSIEQKSHLAEPRLNCQTKEWEQINACVKSLSLSLSLSLLPSNRQGYKSNNAPNLVNEKAFPFFKYLRECAHARAHTQKRAEGEAGSLLGREPEAQSQEGHNLSQR